MKSKLRTLILGFGRQRETVGRDTVLIGLLRLRMPRSKKNIFYPLMRRLLAHDYDRLLYIMEWKNALCDSPDMDADFCNISNLLEYQYYLKRIAQYELVIIMQGVSNYSLLTRYQNKIRRRKGKLAYFVSNEYKNIERKVGFANAVNADYVCSQLPIDAAKWLYEGCRSARILSVPLALNPDRFVVGSNIEKTIDICFCGDLYHNIIGDLERTNIIQYFQENGEQHGISCDIQIGRVKKDEWLAMMMRSKGTIGAESGTYFLDREDKISASVQQYLSQFPSATFEEIFEACFKRRGKKRVSGKCVSSRHFEAIGARTCQILIEGRYNDILKANENYIAVNKDLSNIDEAIGRFKDERYRQTMVDRTYEYVMEKHTYRRRVSDFLKKVI